MERNAAIKLADPITNALLGMGCEVTIAGSIRRGATDVNDCDLVVVPPSGIDAFAESDVLAELQRRFAGAEVHLGYRGGGALLRFPLASGFKIDVRMTSAVRFGATLLWLTGDRAFGDSLEAMAQARGWEFSADGVCFPGTRDLAIDCVDEQAVLREISGGHWVRPSDRVGPFEQTNYLVAS